MIGCVNPEVRVEYKPVFPPAELTQDCKATDPDIVKVNGDLYLLVESLYRDIRVCNADKAGIRQWQSLMEAKD